ncbi:hypothetical protein D3C78_1855190 [compost metagenome]
MPSALWAITPGQGMPPCMASAPTGVVTLGVPQRMASINLPLMPAPKRSGARQMRAADITFNASSAQFMM